MKPQEKNYQKSIDLWIESQEYLIAELKLRERFIKDNIIINKLSLKNVRESIKHEQKQLSEFLRKDKSDKF